MDITNLTSPPPILVHEHNANHGRRRSTSRSTGGMNFSRHPPGPMPIPNTRQDPPPPPLPPPRFIGDLTAGSDPGWAWGNDPSGSFGKTGESMAAGSNFPKSWGRKVEEDRGQTERPEYRRRESSNSTVLSPPNTDRRYSSFSRHQDEGYYSLSGPSAMSQQLHGERQLQQKNIENSSQAYDNKLLSKIGKPKTPPRGSTLSSAESSPTSSRFGSHPSQLRSLSFPNSAYSETPIKREPSSRYDDYGDSPRSRPISPGLFPSSVSTKSFMDYRSPTFERSAPSSATDPDQYSYYPQRFPSSTNVSRQQKARRSNSGFLLSSYDESAGSMKNTKNTTSGHAKSLKQESHDRTIFSEQDSADPTFRMEETVRHLHLEDRPPLNPSLDSIPYYQPKSIPSLHSSRSRPGMKRKLSRSPPPDSAHEANAQLMAAAAGINTDLYPRKTSASQLAPQRRSPVNQYTHNQGSFSSQSSGGPRNGSYASSGVLSVGGSSNTSVDQHSPGGVSPLSEQQQQQHYQQHNDQDSPYVTSIPMNPGPRNSRAQQYPQPPLDTNTTPPTPQKANSNNSSAQRRNNAPSMQSNAFICGCCPKKPKKFDTEQELSNRFKNKNEAERHQNSLHLRRHSWSCATLQSNYDAAFYPSTSIPPANTSPGQPHAQPPLNSLAAFDTCGYCGQEFPNDPAPDWDERAQHLQNVHKFGECNQSKKFFRADHFRQHLKHSHAGTSGKWTNMLETACMKDEPHPEALDNSMPSQGAPVANMGNMGQANMGQPNMGQPDMSHSMGQANMGPANLSPTNMGPANMAQANMGQANMSQMNQNQIDQMSNIDPNIGIPQMGNMAPMGNLGSMAPPSGRGMPLPTQLRGDRIDEMPQEM
ncbi:hypothetical protein MMC28_003021 [Mycoblastus sanguinarius]|nr:hypothetical protein [Mycoblastus sanguinarius]